MTGCEFRKNLIVVGFFFFPQHNVLISMLKFFLATII